MSSEGYLASYKQLCSGRNMNHLFANSVNLVKNKNKKKEKH